jgi:predicted membrane chloride channel (bestrophin family)
MSDQDASPRKYPYVFRISGSVLPSIIWHVVAIGIFAAVVVAISDLSPYSLEINPVLISTLGFIVSLSLSFRTQSSYARWWEAR